MKCDERKPQCDRCLKTGRKCDGYPLVRVSGLGPACQKRIQPIVARSAPPSNGNPELPASKRGSPCDEEASLCKQDGSFLPSIPFALCAPAAEKRSFDFFCKQTVIHWPGWYNLTFWNRLILQVCHDQPLIRHAAVAIGATHESLTLPNDGDGLSERKKSLDSFALLQWNKAISIITKEGDKLPLTVILMSCVVFACLQALQDRHTHHLTLRSGLKIFKKFEDDRRRQIPSTQVSSADLGLIINDIKPLLERFTYRFCQIVDPPHALYLSLLCQRPALVETPAVPSEFSTPSEARDCLENLLHWTCSIVTLESGKPVISTEMAPAVHQLSRQWENALDAGVRRSFQSGPRDESSHLQYLHNANLLKAARLLAFITIETMNDASETKFDRHTDKFREIVLRYRQVVEAKQRPGSWGTAQAGIDAETTDTLLLTACRCRDPAVRREAIDLVANANMAEGAFNGYHPGTPGKTIMALEEAGLGHVTSCEDIPEENRIRVLTCSHYWKLRRTRIEYTRFPYEPALGAPVQELWYSHSGLPTYESAPDGANSCKPTVVLGRGYASSLQPSSSEYYDFVPTSFFFSIPKLNQNQRCLF